MNYKHRYIIQEKPSITVRERLISFLKAPLYVPQWIISFLLARAITNVVLSPSVTAPQKQIQPINFSENNAERHVVINLLSKDPRKTIHDYLLKLGTVLYLPFLMFKRGQLHLSNAQDKAHIDHLIAEIGLLHQGRSQLKHCDKEFAWDEIHLKGVEYLDDDLRHYLYEQLRIQYNWEEQETELRLSFYSLETYDNAVLDSMILSSRQEEEKPMAERKFIINCLANGQNYIKWTKDSYSTATELGCSVISFNYRGIDYSQGLVWTENNMIDDVLAQVSFLLEQGAKPENIGIEGMCLGAAVATLAAAKAHQQNLDVCLYNERSFRSIPRVLAGTIIQHTKGAFWNPITLLGYSLATVVYLITSPIIWISGWSMDVEKAWTSIPSHKKNYSLIRNHQDPDPNAPVDDGIVEDSWASLASLIEERRAIASRKQAAGKPLTKEDEQLLLDNPETHYFKPNPSFDRGNKLPHVLARRHLIQSTGGTLTMHQHMISSFKPLFFHPRPNPYSITNSCDLEIVDHALPI